MAEADKVSRSNGSLFKYVSIANLRHILDGAIRFTQPSAFNDPFELLPEIAMPPDEPARRISISFDTGATRRNTPDEVRDLPETWTASDEMSRDIVKQLSGLVGMLCLSKTFDSLLMWAHYADSYAGAMIEFDGSHEFFSEQIDVCYASLRPRQRINTYVAASDPVPVSELCVKSDQWKYEQEVRIVRHLSECEKLDQNDRRGFPIYVQRIPPACIKSVILGERTPVCQQREIYDRVRDTDIGLLLAAIEHTGYAFRYERVKYNVPYSKMGPMMSPRTAHIFSALQNNHGEFARWMINNHPLSKLVNKPV